MFNEINRVKRVLKENGYRLTPQRRSTLEVILENKGRHMSTEEIYESVKNVPGNRTGYRVSNRTTL